MSRLDPGWAFRSTVRSGSLDAPRWRRLAVHLAQGGGPPGMLRHCLWRAHLGAPHDRELLLDLALLHGVAGPGLAWGARYLAAQGLSSRRKLKDLGHSLLQENRMAEALDCFTLQARVEARDLEALVQMAGLAFRLGRAGEVLPHLAACAQALEGTDFAGFARLVWGQGAVLSGQEQLAQGLLRQADGLGAGPEAGGLLGALLARQGNKPEAAAAWLGSLGQDPFQPGLALALHQALQVPEAEAGRGLEGAAVGLAARPDSPLHEAVMRRILSCGQARVSPVGLKPRRSSRPESGFPVFMGRQGAPPALANAFIHSAVQAGAWAVVLLDDETEPDPGLLERLAGLLRRHPQAAAVGCPVVVEPEKLLAASGFMPGPEGLEEGAGLWAAGHPDWSPASGLHPCLALLHRPLAVSLDAAAQVGRLDEGCRTLAGAFLEWSIRAWRMGRPVLCDGWSRARGGWGALPPRDAWQADLARLARLPGPQRFAEAQAAAAAEYDAWLARALEALSAARVWAPPALATGWM